MSDSKHKNIHSFSKENQPSREAKSLGWKRARLIRDIAKQIVGGKLREDLQELAVEYIGVKLDEINIETAMHLKQMEKALKDGDTVAYNSIMDRLKGKPLQAITMDAPNLPPIKFINDTAAKDEDQIKDSKSDE